MTYYAVTNDPNELMHFGILGMKWGRRRTPEQLGHPRHHGNGRRSSAPRSEAYKKAQSKLGKMMKSGIKKAEASWRAYNSPEAKYERQTNRAIEQARKGKLHYRKLTDDQVRRVTERLALERQARQIADTEKTWKRRLGEAIGTGIITGVGAGVAARTGEWIKRGGELKTERMKEDIKDAYAARSDRRKFKYDVKKADEVQKNNIKNEDKKARQERKRQQEFEEDDAKREKRQKRLEQRNNNREYRAFVRRIEGQQRTEERNQKRIDNRNHRRLEAMNREEARNQKRIDRRNHRRLEAMNREEAQREAARSYSAEVARQRAGKQRMLEEANEREKRRAREEARENARKEAERSRRTKEQGWRDRQERQEYRSRVSQMADDVGSGRSAPFGYNPNANYGTRSTARTRRRRPGRR